MKTFYRLFHTHQSLVIAVSIFFPVHIDDDFNHIDKIILASRGFTIIGYTFFFTVPPFVSAQVINCGAQGKVTQQDQKKKRHTHHRLPFWLRKTQYFKKYGAFMADYKFYWSIVKNELTIGGWDRRLLLPLPSQLRYFPGQNMYKKSGWIIWYGIRFSLFRL